MSNTSIPNGSHATAGWVLIATLVLTAAISITTGAFLWGGFVLTIAGVAVLPALLFSDWTAMVPSPLLSVAVLAAVTRLVGVYIEIAGYLAIVALALILVIELDTFTPVELSRRFAIVFATMTTMAVEGVWIIAQYYSDRWLGSELLRSQVELQWDIVAVTVTAIVVSALYQWYVMRFDPPGSVTVPSGEDVQ